MPSLADGVTLSDVAPDKARPSRRTCCFCLLLVFSAASLWEITIEQGSRRKDFQVDPRLLRRALLGNGYHELPILSDHVVAIDSLPTIHKDPFDRLLVAQAMVEGVTLLTLGPIVAEYPGPIREI